MSASRAFLRTRDAGFVCIVRVKHTRGFKKPQTLAVSGPNRFGGLRPIRNYGWIWPYCDARSKQIPRQEIFRSWSWGLQGQSALVLLIHCWRSARSAKNMDYGSTLMEPTAALLLLFPRRTTICTV